MQLRPLEKRDLPYIYKQENARRVMALWFEEPYTSFDELEILYDKHVLDQAERRFVIDVNDEFAGVVELVYIDNLHRNTEIQIIVEEKFQGQGLAQEAMRAGLEYAFNVINMHKVYLYVDVENTAAVHIYKKIGFEMEGTLKEQFYANGRYHDSYMMGMVWSSFKEIEAKAKEQ
ncbi:GNAT family N-acetyltransferase [Weissella viridescens]|uniref:Acetyltransferase n=3 Tax=Weissella viridescens TaxID=1629 RepID=A0A0R2H1E3_WEIVI|nr:GNAT family N-acetyltransferase [Weissella viridescens]KRN46753.1 acetyltransferase [Weissella viridescens]MBX4172520.1 GNAT family N-acetyltransferase [Weissella viridescens]MCB6840767.1 GNAT family N-acetyltransferase [Weissella viridescens]MCB6847516.1 GNAT family N-acetyltransferase [Weissella viridescens]QOD86682.1 GNAT family N-acetyltransferase [Weissella viridescens]